MKDPYASDERKSMFLAGFRCNAGCNTWDADLDADSLYCVLQPECTDAMPIKYNYINIDI